MYCRVYLRKNEYNLYFIFMVTYILVKMSIYQCFYFIVVFLNNDNNNNNNNKNKNNNNNT